ncbi:MAG: hypothetical protein KAJ51_13705 [Thermoplasmata archaeon]|nr:hypothetical protein [Thermoplasmata archaeon]
MKASTLVMIIIILMSLIMFIGCLGNDNGKNDSQIYFLLSYSTSSDIEDNVTVIISTNNIEVFNDTIIPQKGSEIYREKASGNSYNVIAIWNNNITKMNFEPSGLNSLSLSIRNQQIELQEITD